MNKLELTHPHDLLVRNFLTDADMAADFLRNYLAPEVVGKLDLEQLKCESPGTVDENLVELLGDLRFSTVFKGSRQKLEVFVFLEHQSKQDRFISFRLLEYICKAYRQHLSDSPAKRAKTFPYPLAVVLYHGKKPWNTSLAMRDLIDGESEMDDAALLHFPVHLIDLAKIPTGELKGAPAIQALLDSLQSASTGRLTDQFEKIVGRISDACNDSRFVGWITALTRYAASQCRPKRGKEAIIQALNMVFDKKEVKDMASTLVEEWLREGRAQGKAEGKAEGIAEGKAEGIVTILETRFGSVPAKLRKTIAACKDIERLEMLLPLAVTCATLKEFQQHFGK